MSLETQLCVYKADLLLHVWSPLGLTGQFLEIKTSLYYSLKLQFLNFVFGCSYV